MRMSCNGCRILRKGCSENCSIRPCLQWIKSPESQANATVFLAKFYGRAGLMNLINAGPDHLRPAIFRSLLYEACGRIVNPIYGSVGLLWSGSWQLCQTAVEAVLKGSPITPIATEAAATSHGPPLKAYDIRHVSRDETSASDPALRPRTRCRFKRKPKVRRAELSRDESSVSHHFDGGESKETTESMVSVETVEPTVAPARGKVAPPAPAEEPALELTLGFEPIRVVPVKKRRVEAALTVGFDGACKTELGLECPA